MTVCRARCTTASKRCRYYDMNTLDDNRSPIMMNEKKQMHRSLHGIPVSRLGIYPELPKSCHIAMLVVPTRHRIWCPLQPIPSRIRLDNEPCLGVECTTCGAIWRAASRIKASLRESSLGGIRLPALGYVNHHPLINRHSSSTTAVSFSYVLHASSLIPPSPTAQRVAAAHCSAMMRLLAILRLPPEHLDCCLASR